MESWRDVPGFEGRYQVSDQGRVRSWVNRRGEIILMAHPLKPGTNRKGYQYVLLSRNGKRQYFFIHQLVLLAFAGAPAQGQEGSHLNDDRADNRRSNLAWETHQENERRKRRLSGAAVGKLDERQVEEIRSRRGERLVALAKEFGVSHATIWNVQNGVTYH